MYIITKDDDLRNEYDDSVLITCTVNKPELNLTIEGDLTCTKYVILNSVKVTGDIKLLGGVGKIKVL